MERPQCIFKYRKKDISMCFYLLEPFSLKMCMRSAKAYDFCMPVCFAFINVLLSCLQTCILSSVIKRANCQNIQKQILIQLLEKWHDISYQYISYIKSETSGTWRTGAQFLRPFKERVEKNHTYDLVKPNSTKKQNTIGGVT